MKSIVFDDERSSDSPFVEKVWTSHSERGGKFISSAECRWEIVLTKLEERATLYVRGPESKATVAYCPPEGEWIGIRFRPDTYLNSLPPRSSANMAIAMPASEKGKCWMFGHSLEVPGFDNAEMFVSKLIQFGYLTRDPLIGNHLAGKHGRISTRTIQRRFAQIIGLSVNQVFQIERARYAANLLREGETILDTVHAAGYFDQAHLTKWVKELIGVSPSKIAETSDQGGMSFLYKTKLPTSP